VGKPTTSAALALGLARRGHRVAVITIDPARRLASALGLAELPNEPHRVELEAEGELWAMMLDVKRTFDDVIARLAPDEATRDRIFANRIYGELSTAVAGSQEFTAIAKLYDLALDDRFDVLVLDTPPSRNALDFLEAPDRLSDFLEGRALRMLLRPAGVGAKIVGRSTGAVFGLLAKATGTDLLSDLSEFFRSLAGLTDGFRERATHVKALLSDPGTVFVLVTSPEREPIDEALFMAERLEAARLDVGGVVVNRMHHDLLGDTDPEGVADNLREALGEALADRAATTLREYHVLARRDDAGVRRLLDGLGPVPLVLVPHLDTDIADLAGLGDVERWLFATDEERAAMLAAVTA
ncbi:MAG TPA: ArsA-related P-loop ATPase, partial [Solirubrobacteraceae bacterium]|jgi:anion-transporting  ArsA/GET3 family ATPase